MGWEFHAAKAMFARFAADWDRLNRQLYDGHPYLDSRFIGPLLEHFANGREQLCIHRSDGAISGALILRPEGMGRWSSFRPAQAQITALLLDDVRLLETLPAKLPGITWKIELQAIDPRYSPDFLRLALPLIIHPHARTIGIRLENGFPDYWGNRPKKLIANVDRYSRRAENEFGAAVVTTFEDTADMAAGVKRFGALEAAGWKGAAGTAVSRDNQQAAFYSEVLRSFAATGQATVHELHVAGRFASSRLVLSSERMVVFLKTAYDESLARIAPGRILLHRVIEKKFARHSGKTIEFYTNASRDQAEWATLDCTVQNIEVFRNDFCATAFALLKVIRRNLRSADNRRTTSNEDTPAIDVKTCTSVKAFATAQYDLDEFAARNNIETSIGWFDLLQSVVYPDDPGVRYYFIAEKDRAATILPLRLTSNGRVRTVESLGNYYTSLYTPLLTANSDLLTLRHILAAATREHHGAHVMRFAPMDPESAAYKGLLNDLQAIGWIPFKFFCFGNWFLKVDGDWEGYLRKRSANLRSSIKRRNKEFTADGGTLEVATGTDGVEQAIAVFQEVYMASWKIPEPYPDFVPSLIRRLAPLGMLRLGIARLQGKPIAAQLWIVGEGKASIYKVAYHEAFAAYSPGSVLTSYLLQHVIEHDHVKEVDFLIGDDEYKKIWMSHRRERWGIIAYNPRTIIGFALLMREVSGRIARSAGKKYEEALAKLQQAFSAPANVLTAFRMKYFKTSPPDERPLTWTIYPVSQFADFSTQWDTLVRCRPGTPFLESAFLQPSIDTFGSGNERLCLLHANGQLRAAAIMQRERKGIWQTFQPSQLPLGAWVSDGNVDLMSACRELVHRLPGLTLGIGASQLDSRFQTRPHDSEKIRTQDYIQTAWVDIKGSFELFWEARGKNLKQNTRKQRNKLQAEGIETRIECITAPGEVPKAIEDYGLLESAGWKAGDGTAVLSDNAQGHFYRKMLENFCALGRGRIYRYWFGNKVVAMDLCIHDQSVIVILKTTYDASYKAVSPSTLMRQDEFKQLFEEQKFSRIEFYGKVMEWHTRWTAQSRDVFHVTAYRWAWLKQLHARRLKHLQRKVHIKTDSAPHRENQSMTDVE